MPRRPRSATAATIPCRSDWRGAARRTEALQDFHEVHQVHHAEIATELPGGDGVVRNATASQTALDALTATDVMDVIAPCGQARDKSEVGGNVSGRPAAGQYDASLRHPGLALAAAMEPNASYTAARSSTGKARLSSPRTMASQ